MNTQSDAELYREILHGVRAIVQKDKGARGMLRVSPEVAALLAAPLAPVHAPLPEAPTMKPAPVFLDTEAATPTMLEQRAAALAELAAEVAQCRKCGLCETRKQTVFSDGDPCAEICFVGEAPGADEDQTGVPFVGKAGQLLTDIIEKGMKIPRGTVYICNVLKCRPPGNRDPNPEEVMHCEPYLKHQLKIVRPKVIVALGRHAAHTLLKTSESTARLRGKWHEYEGIPLRVTYHPSYLLRTPADKAKTWEDIKEVMKFLDAKRGEEA